MEFLFLLANSTKMCYTYDNLSRVTEVGAVAGLVVGVGIDLFFRYVVDDHITYIVENN